jgi:hypothetical protein
MADDPDNKTDGTDDLGTGDGDGSGDGDKPAMVQLSQTQLDSMMDKMFAKGARNSADAKKLRELQEANTRLEAQLADAQNSDGDGDGNKDGDARLQQMIEQQTARIEALETENRKKDEEHDKTVTKMLEQDLRGRIIGSAAKAGAREPQEVYTLMSADGIFDVDDESGNWIVKNDKGQVRLDIESGGEPMSPEKAVIEWLDGRPHHKRSSGRTGSGQGESGGAGKDTPTDLEDIRKLSPSEIYGKRDEILARIRSGGGR